MSYLGNNGWISRLIATLEITIQDRLEQCYRISRKLVRPFRYWNILSLLSFAESNLYFNGILFFLGTNRMLLRGQTLMTNDNNAQTVQRSAVFRRRLSTWEEAGATLFWATYCWFLGFPFFWVRHPAQKTSSSGMSTAGWFFRQWLHPTVYWSFLSIYKVVWSTRKVASAAWWLSDPRKSPKFLGWMHRERILELNNIRYQSQWGELQKEIFGPQNKDVRYVQVINKWVSLGSLGAAVHDIIDEARERERLSFEQVEVLFGRMGGSLRNLEVVSISMTLPLPLMAVGRLLQTAPKLRHLQLDGVALSVQDLQQDIIEFGRILHGINTSSSSHNSRLPLSTFRILNCWLVDDDMDPQERQRFSMDLLLSPAIFTALTPPTRLHLQHLTLRAKCQMISALELAVMLRVNTSLESLNLGLRHEGDDDGFEEQDDDWFVVPLCQILQYANRTLKSVSLLLSTGIDPTGFSHRALRNMMKHNDTLEELNLIRSDQQLRVRIPEVDFYLYLNHLKRRRFRLNFNEIPRSKWINLIIAEKRNTAVVYYFLSLYPTLVINYTKTDKPTRNMLSTR